MRLIIEIVYTGLMIGYRLSHLMLSATGTSSGPLSELAALNLLLRATDPSACGHRVRFIMMNNLCVQRDLRLRHVLRAVNVLPDHVTVRQIKFGVQVSGPESISPELGRGRRLVLDGLPEVLESHNNAGDVVESSAGHGGLQDQLDTLPAESVHGGHRR